MAAQPIDPAVAVAQSAYISYVKERGHLPKHISHLFNYAKYDPARFPGIRYTKLKKVIVNPPNVAEYLRKPITSLDALDAKDDKGPSMQQIYDEYLKAHNKKAPSTAARLHHFAQKKKYELTFAQANYFLTHLALQKPRQQKDPKPARQKRRIERALLPPLPLAPPQAPPQAPILVLPVGVQKAPIPDGVFVLDAPPPVAPLTSLVKRSARKALLKDIQSLGQKSRTEEIKAEEEEKKAFAELIEGDFPVLQAYQVNFDHMFKPVRDFTEDFPLEGAANSSKRLLELFDKIPVSDEELAMWAGYGGGRLFNNKQHARERLASVIGYTEDNKSCPAVVHKKMRMIGHLIIEKGVERKDEFIHVLLLLAQHGNVCNVMKEVAIGNAYGCLTDKLAQFVEEHTLDQQILKVLRDLRILLIEKLFKHFKMTNNTHYIAGFHNVLAKDVGVTEYHDEHICTPSSSVCNNWRKGLKQRYHAEYYTVNEICRFIEEQITEKRIGYQKVVEYFQENCPKDTETIEFLQKAIDVDTGDIRQEFMAWMLHQMEIFKRKDINWKAPQVTWDPIKK